jgi:hypothetical protein
VLLGCTDFAEKEKGMSEVKWTSEALDRLEKAALELVEALKDKPADDEDWTRFAQVCAEYADASCAEITLPFLRSHRDMAKALEALLKLEQEKAGEEGLADCLCISWDANTERAYENGTCPHQMARAALRQARGE